MRYNLAGRKKEVYKSISKFVVGWNSAWSGKDNQPDDEDEGSSSRDEVNREPRENRKISGCPLDDNPPTSSKQNHKYLNQDWNCLNKSQAVFSCIARFKARN